MVKSTALRSSAIRDLLELTERPHVLSLAGGLPDPASFPVAEIAEATTACLTDDPTGALQYGPTEGYRPLRDWVAAQLDGQADDVVITAGSQQALDLLARTLVDPGDVVALAEPAYIGALQAFRAAGAQLMAIPAGRHGMDVEVLAERLRAGLRPRLVYVVANFDNPSGATMDEHGRRTLAELAEQYGFWIVDDDPYGELRWRGTPATPLRQLTDRTITVGSTSKVLCPGLRVGWVLAPAEVGRPVVIAKQAADLHSSSLTQQIAHRLLARPGFLGAHLDHLRATYRIRAEAMATGLRTRLGDDVAFDDPDGGMFIWARLCGRLACDTAALLPRAIDHGVAYVPGSAFAVDRPDALAPWLRLSFATGDPQRSLTAIDRLATALGS